MQCEECGHYWTGPGYDSEIHSGTSCPSCGSYRTQVSPTHSEMEMRDMPGPAGENARLDDMGGNPLQEGIWGSIDGGWKNRMKRDESFASVRQSNHQVLPSGGQAPGFHGDVRDILREIEKFKPGITLNGLPLEEGLAQIPPNSVDPVQVAHGSFPKAGQIAAATIQDGHGNRWRDMMAKAKQKAQQRVPVAGRIAFEDDLWGDDDDALDPYTPYESPNKHIDSRFIIDKRGAIHFASPELLAAKGNDPEKVFHEDIANEVGMHTMGQDGREYPDMTLGHAQTDGQLKILHHDTDFDGNQIASMLSSHYPEHQLDPESVSWNNRSESLMGQGQEEDPWAGIMREIDQNKAPREPSTSLDDYMKGPFWQNRASTRDNMYLPWQYDTEKIAHDFDVVQIIPDGPHTEEVDINGEPVIMQSESPEALAEAKQKVAFAPLIGLLGTGAARMIGSGVISGLVRGAMGQGAGGAAGGNAGQPMEAQPIQNYSFHKELAFDGPFDNHPSSDPELGERASGDPEDVDSQEVNDGDHSEWQNDPEVNDQGGTDSFQPNEEVIHALEEAEPALLHYFHSEESGENDPAIQKLIQAIERHHPGVLDQDPSDDDLNLLKSLKTSGLDKAGTFGVLSQGVPGIGGYGVGGFAAPPGTQPLQSPVQNVQQQVAPHTQANCPHCGARLAAGQGVCPQCNGSVALAPNTEAPIGPPPPGQLPGQVVANAGEEELKRRLEDPSTSPQQRAALMQAVIMMQNNRALEQGRERGMQQNQGITSAHQGPHSIEQIQAVAQFLMSEGRQAEIPNLIANPDQYGDELAQISERPEPPDADPDPAAPVMDPSMMGGAPAGPPGMAPPGGMPPMMGNRQGAADNVAPSCPKCDSHTTGITSEEGDCECSACGHNWSPGGAQKQVNMPATAARTSIDHSDLHPHVDAPGVPAADQTHDDDPQKDINPGAWMTDSGEPLMVGKEYEMKSAAYDIPDRVRIESIKPDEIEYSLTGVYNLSHRTSISKEEAQMNGLSFSSVEDSDTPEDNLNEQGPSDQMQAPNLAPAFASRQAAPFVRGPIQPGEEKLQSENYPEENNAKPIVCPNCGEVTKPVLGGCPHCNTAFSMMPHQAGKKFTPMEQREFIDESGVARNKDKLNLENTHYVEQPGLSDDLFLFGL